MSAARLALIFRQMSQIVDGMSDDEVRDFLRAMSAAARQRGNAPQKKSVDREKKRKAPDDPRAILNKLRMAKSTQEGEKILDDSGLARPGLAIVARMAEVHVVKQDNLADVREKLIAETVGARLNSEAIRGTGR